MIFFKHKDTDFPEVSASHGSNRFEIEELGLCLKIKLYYLICIQMDRLKKDLDLVNTLLMSTTAFKHLLFSRYFSCQYIRIA